MLSMFPVEQTYVLVFSMKEDIDKKIFVIDYTAKGKSQTGHSKTGILK